MRYMEGRTGRMELRHLRYFVAVAETGSLTLAAEKRLHTAQPSLSRQIRDLEREVGVQLLDRSPQGTELTAAGRAFLDHARLSLAEADAAAEAARRAAQPAKAVFSIGFLTGQEIDWLPHAPSILRDELPDLEIRVSSGFSTDLADDLQKGKLDVAFLRREPKPDLEYRLVTKEPFVVILPSDHPLAGAAAIAPHQLRGQIFIGISDVAPVLRSVIRDYLKRSGIEIVPALEIDNFMMATSLVESTRGVALLPASARGYLSGSVTSRPLAGEQPTVDLMIGYHRANRSPILEKFLSGIDALSARIYGKARAG
jgi:LysR family transcriptional regulator, hca operon transcriptional activator